MDELNIEKQKLDGYCDQLHALFDQVSPLFHIYIDSLFKTIVAHHTRYRRCFLYIRTTFKT